jgi:hypothetical protein
MYVLVSAQQVTCTQAQSAQANASRSELELELIQTHMTKKPLLWVEVGAHAVRKRSESAGVVQGARAPK